MHKNPVIPGFYSDPSVCRVGDAFYLATSSFEFSPGVPIFRSRDLVHWQQIGHALTRPSQLNLQHAVVSDGIFAPTLRHHDGVFYLITSNRCARCGNHFFVTATDPEGPWSEPVWITAPDGSYPDGLDPSLFFAEDGRVFFSCVAWDVRGQGVGQAEIDLSSGRLKEPCRVVWHGTGGTFPEGPHTYKRFGRYYLMIAEGGTEYGHKVSLARADRIEGPYQACPSGAILTQAVQRMQDSELQGVGHGELIEDRTGQWWLIAHAFRTSIGKLHHLGRETVLAPVVWGEDGWPVCGDAGCLTEEIPALGVVATAATSSHFLEASAESAASTGAWVDRFADPQPALAWNYLRIPDVERYRCGDGELRLLGSPIGLSEVGSPTWIGVRQRHFDCTFTAEIQYAPQGGEQGGITVYQTPEHHYDLLIRREGRATVAQLRKVVGDIEQWLDPVTLQQEADPVQLDSASPMAGAQRPLRLRVEATRRAYDFYVEAGERSFFLGSGRTQLISTEVMQYQNFTGTYLALFAVTPQGQRAMPLRVSCCEYSPKDREAE